MQIKGKEYRPVAERLIKFWTLFPDAVIRTNAYPQGDNIVFKAVIVDRNSGEELATGHSQAFYDGTEKLAEKTETVAVGRALGLLCEELMGGEIASADEIATWVQHGNDQALLDHVACVRDNWESIVYIKHHLGEADAAKMNNKDSWMDLETALEAWRELGEDVMKVLWRAPSKGGIFTTLERKLLDEASTEDFKRRKAGEG